MFSKGFLVWVKNMKIFHLFILCKVDKENLFKNIPHSKKDLLGNQKTLILKSQKLCFSKGVRQWFGQKLENFPVLILGKIGKENVFDDIL